MKKRIAKMLTVAMVLASMFSLNVSAAEVDTQQQQEVIARTQEHTGNYSDSFSTGYFDEWGVYRKVVVNASCIATVKWDEGYYGWIVSAHFNAASATIDDESVSITTYGSTSISGSSAAQQYKINNKKYITVRVNVDEWGDVWMSGTFE